MRVQYLNLATHVSQCHPPLYVFVGLGDPGIKKESCTLLPGQAMFQSQPRTTQHTSRRQVPRGWYLLVGTVQFEHIKCECCVGNYQVDQVPVLIYFSCVYFCTYLPTFLPACWKPRLRIRVTYIQLINLGDTFIEIGNI